MVKTFQGETFFKYDIGMNTVANLRFFHSQLDISVGQETKTGQELIQPCDNAPYDI